MNIGAPEIVLIILAILLLFGYKKLPDASRSLGRSRDSSSHAVGVGMVVVRSVDAAEPVARHVRDEFAERYCGGVDVGGVRGWIAPRNLRCEVPGGAGCVVVGVGLGGFGDAEVA